MSFKTSIKMLGLAIFLLLSSALFGVQPKTVTVKIEYNGLSTDISTEINFEEEITALEALMKVAKVQTHPIGEHVFVDAINDFENRKGEKAWYYFVNDEYATKLAIDMKLNQGDVVTWLYKQEVCSKTIDGNSSATKKN